jgi:tRNA G18 (ribose-2'-O)-methylase SpoU
MILILNKIRSLYNVGSIFRSADGFGVEKIYLCEYTPCPPRKEISKTALGAEEVVDWEYFENSKDLILKLKKDGYQIVSLEKNDKSEAIENYVWSEKTALILGNEIDGVDVELLERSDAVVHISMRGIKESFNVASAAAVAMYSFDISDSSC